MFCLYTHQFTWCLHSLLRVFNSCFFLLCQKNCRVLLCLVVSLRIFISLETLHTLCTSSSVVQFSRTVSRYRFPRQLDHYITSYSPLSIPFSKVFSRSFLHDILLSLTFRECFYYITYFFSCQPLFLSFLDKIETFSIICLNLEISRASGTSVPTKIERIQPL